MVVWLWGLDGYGCKALMALVVMTHIPDELGPEEDVEKACEAQPGQAGQQETWNGVNIN